MIHLHLHSEYSSLDGASKVSTLIDRAIELGQKAIAFTEHGNMLSVYAAAKHSADKEIKAIQGCEFYVRHKDTPKKRYHITVLVSDETGYHNLVKLNNYAWTKGFYGKPMISHKELIKHQEGLIVLSGCFTSLACELANENKSKFFEYVKFMNSKIDQFFLEVMPHDLETQNIYTDRAREARKCLEIPLVATNDTHYAFEEDYKIRNVLLANNTGKSLQEVAEKFFDGSEQGGSGLHLRSDEEMVEAFKAQGVLNSDDISDAIRNTHAIAAICKYTLKHEGKIFFPVFEGTQEEKRERVRIKLRKKYAKATKEYKDRCAYEMKVIESLGFWDYFVTLKCIMDLGTYEGVEYGPGRGSAAGCLVAYWLNITDVDPIKHGLFFERFLNPDRVSPPDIDIDIPASKRPRFIEMLGEIWGQENIMLCATFSTIEGKSAIKDAARALGVSADKINEFTKNCYPASEQGKTIPLEQAVANYEPMIKEIKANSQIKAVINKALLIAGLKRNVGVHASACIINSDRRVLPIVSNSPEWFEGRKEVLGLDMHQTEELGLQKYDFLGLSALDVLSECKKEFNLKPDEEEPRIYEYINNPDKDLFGIFQVEGAGISDMCKRMRPSDISELAVCIALYRPGPMLAGMHETYIDRKNGVSYRVPQAIYDTLKPTYGVIVYQEQIMEISKIVCGYSGAQADSLRKVVGKKQVDKMKEHEEAFLSTDTMSKEEAQELWNQIVTFARYGFNKSHSLAYAIIAAHQLFYKSLDELKYYKCLIQGALNAPNGKDKALLRARQLTGMVGFDIEKSRKKEVIIEDGKILLAEYMIKGVGLKSLKNNNKGLRKKAVEDSFAAFGLYSDPVNNPFHRHRKKWHEEQGILSCKQINNGRYVNQGVWFLGTVAKKDSKKTKTGNPFLDFQVVDETGVVSCVGWSEFYYKYQESIKVGTHLLLQGKVSERGVTVYSASIIKSDSE